MKKLTMFTIVTIALLLSACGSSDDKKVKVIKEVPSVFSSYKGVWSLKVRVIFGHLVKKIRNVQL
jgi:major membrane immunogen (membrane-anchored lipoprotein)